MQRKDTTILSSPQLQYNYTMNAALLFFISILWLLAEGSYYSNHLVLDVTEFGAVGDGITEDSAAIRRAISYAFDDDSHSKIVLFPSNKTFISAPLNLTSNMTFQVDGVLKAITNSTLDFDNKWPQIPPLGNYASSDDNGEVFTIPSLSIFSFRKQYYYSRFWCNRCHGPWWWYAFRHNSHSLPAGRPNLIQVVSCSDVEITGVVLKDSPFWTIHPVFCDNVHIHHMAIRAPMYAPNVDGIDPDSSSNVLIEYNDISCGDDHIAVKAGRCGLGNSWIDGLKCQDDPRFASGELKMSNLTIRYNIFRIGECN
jgi:polygalacturonase